MKQERIQLGIHISDQDLSQVAVRSDKNKIEIAAWQRVPLESGLVNGGQIQNVSVVAHQILRFLHENKLSITNTMLSLTMNVVRLKVSQVKATSDEELHKQVKQELERYTPYGRDNTYSTYRILPHSGDDEAVTSVLQVMSSRCAGDHCLAVCQRARVSSPVLEVALLPLMRVLIQQGTFPEGTVSLLCVFDANAGMMCVLQGSSLIFCQNIDVGVQALVADNACIETLHHVGKPVIDYARSLSDQRLTMLVAANGCYEDLRTVVMRVRGSFRQIQVRQLSSPLITKNVGITRHPDNRELPILALASALDQQTQEENANAWNLIHPDSLERVSVHQEMSRLGMAIAVIVFLAVAAIVPVNMKTKRVQADSHLLESQIVEARPVLEKIQAKRKEIQVLKEQVMLYQKGFHSVEDMPWHRLLAVLVARVPTGLRMVRLDTDPEGDFAVMGEALNESLVHRYVENLKAEPLIADAEVEEVQYGHPLRLAVDYKISGRLSTVEPNEP